MRDNDSSVNTMQGFHRPFWPSRGRLAAKTSFALLFSCLPILAMALDSQAARLIAIFIGRDPGITVARAELASDISSTRLGLAASSIPSFSAQASGTSGSLGFQDPAAAYRNASFGVDLSGSIVLEGESRLQLAKVGERAAEARYRLAEQDRVASFLGACVDLIEARERQRLEAGKVETFAGLMSNAHIERAAGAGTEVAVLAARQALSSAKADFHDATSELERREAIVGDLLGEALPSSLDFGSLGLPGEGSFDASPWARQAAAEIELAHWTREAEKAAFIPSIGLSLSTRLSPFAASWDSFLGVSAGATLGLSLPRQGASAAAQDRFEASRARTELYLSSRRREAEAALIAVSRATERIAYFREAREDADSYVAAVEASFSAGASTIGEVLDAKSVLSARSLALLSAEALEARAKIGLLRSMGFAFEKKQGAR